MTGNGGHLSCPCTQRLHHWAGECCLAYVGGVYISWHAVALWEEMGKTCMMERKKLTSACQYSPALQTKRCTKRVVGTETGFRVRQPAKAGRANVVHLGRWRFY